jgi:hypothetical protein
VTEEAWADVPVVPTPEQLAAWQVRDLGPGRLPVLSGNCPFCQHQYQEQVIERAIHGGVPSRGSGTASVEPVTRLMRCGCDRIHTGAKEPVRGGCGRFWLGRITGGPGAWRLSVATDQALLPAARALRHAADIQSKEVQVSAEKWVAGITALLGLFSIATIVTGKDATLGLAPAGKAAVGLAFIAAISGAATSLISGYTAAFGWPVPVSVRTDTELEAWHQQQQEYVYKASNRLRTAVVAALSSLFALIVVAGLLWFLPRTGRS